MDELRPIRGQVRTTDHRRVSHGLYQPISDDNDSRREQLRDLHAWRLVLPDDAVFTHLTAAWLSEWWLPPLRQAPPVFSAIPLGSGPVNRVGMICSRLKRESRGGFVAGLAVDEPAEVLLRAARDLSHLDLVVMLDSALRREPDLAESIAELLRSRRPGVRPLRAAVADADPRSESAGESLLRLFHQNHRIAVEPQVDIFGADGAFVARGDLLVCGTNAIHEYDGAGHREGDQHRRDLRRGRRLDLAGRVRRGFTLDDLINHPAVVASEMGMALGRPMLASRVRAWRRLVDDSAYSRSGRERLHNRWWRHNGAPIVA